MKLTKAHFNESELTKGIYNSKIVYTVEELVDIVDSLSITFDSTDIVEGEAEVSFVISLFTAESTWTIYENDVKVLSSDSTVNSDYSYTSYGATLGKVNVSAERLRGKNLTLKIVGSLSGISLTDTSNNGRKVTVNSFSPTAVTQSFKVSKAELRVPDVLPDYIVNLSQMFKNVTNLVQDISGWDTSNVENMSSTFSYASLPNLDISGWDVSNVKDMSYMFFGAYGSNPEIGNWDVSKVEDMRYMFKNFAEFNQDLSGWCVPLISSKPSSFNTSSGLSGTNLPVWGTCPV